MYRIVDTINYPNGASQKKGVLAILDPDQVRAPLPPVSKIRISMPDGSSTILDGRRN